MGERRNSPKKTTFVTDMSRPNPYRRPLLSNRQTTERSITFVRNWDSSSPVGQLSFNLDSLLEKSEGRSSSGHGDKQTTISDRVSASPVPIVIASASPMARVLPRLVEDLAEEGQGDAEMNQGDEDDYVPETQQIHHKPIEFDDEDIVYESSIEDDQINTSKSALPSQSKTSRRTPKSHSGKKDIPKGKVLHGGNESSESQKSAKNKKSNHPERRSSRGQLEMPNLFGREKSCPHVKPLWQTTPKSPHKPIEFDDKDVVYESSIEDDQINTSKSALPSQSKTSRRTPKSHSRKKDIPKRKVLHSGNKSSESQKSAKNKKGSHSERRSSRGQLEMPNLFGREKSCPHVKLLRQATPKADKGISALTLAATEMTTTNYVHDKSATPDSSENLDEDMDGEAGKELSRKPPSPGGKSSNKQETERHLSKTSSTTQSRRSSTRGQVALPNLFGSKKSGPSATGSIETSPKSFPETNSTVKARKKQHGPAHDKSSDSSPLAADEDLDGPHEQHSPVSPMTSSRKSSKSRKISSIRGVTKLPSPSRKSSPGGIIGTPLFGKKNRPTAAPSPVTPLAPAESETPMSYHMASAVPPSGQAKRTKRTRNVSSPGTVTRSHAETGPDDCVVRLWLGEDSKRLKSQIIDIDILLNRFEEIAWDIRQHTASKDIQRALNIFAKGVQSDLRDTIEKAVSVKTIESSLLKSKNKLNRKRKLLLVANRELSALHNDIANLRKHKELRTSKDVPNETQQT